MPSAVDYLVSSQHHNGGWGYSPSNQPTVEPTSVALLALRDEPTAIQAVQKGIDWLLRCQHQDGGWGISEDDQESGWQTTWALMVLRNVPGVSEPVRRALDWLAHVPTAQIGLEEFQSGEIPSREDPGALVWPWMPSQVTWIEPTALAVLAFSGFDISPLALARLKAALGFFHLNRTPSGGWDTGNAGPLDVPVIPRAYQTSLVLMAMAGTPPGQVLPEDLRALRDDLASDSSPLSLASGLLALHIQSGDDPKLRERLSNRQAAEGSWSNNPFFTGWAVMALRGYI